MDHMNDSNTTNCWNHHLHSRWCIIHDTACTNRLTSAGLRPFIIPCAAILLCHCRSCHKTTSTSHTALQLVGHWNLREATQEGFQREQTYITYPFPHELEPRPQGSYQCGYTMCDIKVCEFFSSALHVLPLARFRGNSFQFIYLAC